MQSVRILLGITEFARQRCVYGTSTTGPRFYGSQSLMAIKQISHENFKGVEARFEIGVISILQKS